ncbi:MAG: hypothetical protein JSS78_01125 [Bacteroidetes bacterium]|nr:hypothetical protein [Bacteroidota bacterium]
MLFLVQWSPDELNNFIVLLDYLLLPLYLFIIFVAADFIRDNMYPLGHPWRPYFMPALSAKIIGAIFIGLIYRYYYGGGDTANYFFHAKVINGAFGESVIKWFNLLLRIPPWYDGAYSDYISQMWWYEAPAEYTVASITAILGTITFTTYLPIAVLFSVISFTGVWALFRTFATKYPQFTKQIAWCTLFIPSTIMWGSGIFKDTLCMFGLGWLTHSVFRMLMNRDYSIGNIIMAVISFWLISSVKLYILLAFIPALLLWILFTYSHRIRNGITRTAVKLMVVMGCFVGFLFFAQKFAAELGKYSLTNMAQTSYTTSSYIAAVSSDGGSAYHLGSDDPSLSGMLKKFPLAVNVTLFRPYLWETRKPFQLLNAFEATMFMWITLKILFTIGFKKVRKTIAEDPTIQFCLIFAVIFAFAVGLSSGNFGALSRYRIPCLPFYGIALVLIFYKHNPIEKNIFSFKR